MAKHWHSSETQIYWTCEALIERRFMSYKIEIREVRCWRLAAIVHCLKDEFGWPITTQYRCPENVGHYMLRDVANVSKLRFSTSAQALSDEEAA